MKIILNKKLASILARGCPSHFGRAQNRQPIARLLRLGMLLIWLAGLSGCATGPVLPTPPLSGTDCLRFYHELDDAITRVGVRDAGAASISGYPFLRTNRFLASLKADLAGPEGYQSWVAA